MAAYIEWLVPSIILVRSLAKTAFQNPNEAQAQQLKEDSDLFYGKSVKLDVFYPMK
jgi:hypothetical protein